MSTLTNASAVGTLLCGELPMGRIEVTVDRAEMVPQALFSLATRNNPKRAFLFLSHVLGKHLPVVPTAMEAVHERLARHIPELPQPVVFIGMAETATCLGQGVFEAWLRTHPGQEAVYLHTTRYQVRSGLPINFEEAHSHAPLQWLYQPEDPTLSQRFQHARSLVLIDDEISTGSTFANLARACRVHSPAITHVHLAAITDFTGPTRKERLATQLDTELSIGALLYGQWHFEPNNHVATVPPAAQAPSGRAPIIVDHGFGRLGRSPCLTLPRDRVDALGQGIRPADRVLVLGTGEFMHPAFVLARELHEATGASVLMHATTRSPIVIWGPIEKALTFTDNYGEGVPNFLYNCGADQYDHVFLCHETGPTPSLIAVARQLGARLLHFRSELEIEENPVR